MAGEMNLSRSATLLLFLCHFCEGFMHQMKSLTPEITLYNQVLHHKETALYHLNKLERGFSYELRVSYLASTPTEFLIKIEDNDAATAASHKLLNIDKIVFTTGIHGMVQLARVTAIRVGLPSDRDHLNDPVVYNIALEKLYFGLTSETWKLAIIVLCSIVIVVKWIVPKINLFLGKEITRLRKNVD